MGSTGPLSAGVDWTPWLGIAAIGAALAALPIVAWWRRRRGADPAARLRALALLALVLTFDLVLVGAFTRLSDSGLGCPDWPGCYGHASPLGAREHIEAAQAAIPGGAVTRGKAWIEMAHRYFATAVGVLVIALAALAVVERRRRRVAAGAGLAIAAVLWIVAQGAFGALTVTMRLYPAIVTLHLLGGLALLALLAAQVEAYEPRRWTVGRPLRVALHGVCALVVVQIALGGWVSTNYAVLACRDFPSCDGTLWWPHGEVDAGFTLRRALGTDGAGGWLPSTALMAIHMAHRLGAFVVVPAVLALAAALGRARPEARPWAWALLGIVAWQAASGLGNVLLGWPLAAAVGHTAGSAALVVALTVLVVRTGRSIRPSVTEGADHRADRDRLATGRSGPAVATPAS